MDNEKGKLLFQHFGRAMKGEPLRKWSKLTKNQRVYTLLAFKEKFSDLIEDLFGEDVYDDQLEYLCDESMPTSMKSSEWIDRIKVINAALPSLTKGGKEMTERELVRKVVTANIPESWKRDFTLQGGDKLKTLKDAKKALMKIERAYGFEPRTSRKKARTKTSDNGNENGDRTDSSSSGKKQCRLQGHDHMWKDCPNNPYSSGFGGTHFSIIRERERAAANEAKLEDKNKDDESAHKSTRSKYRTKGRSEEVHATEDFSGSEPGVPMVTFRHVEQFLDDDESYKSAETMGQLF
jgi:hypothetical protein